MFEIKACEVSKKRSPGGYRDEFFRNKHNAEIGHYGQTLIIHHLYQMHPALNANFGVDPVCVVLYRLKTDE
jgi:hypothetical protein